MEIGDDEKFHRKRQIFDTRCCEGEQGLSGGCNDKCPPWSSRASTNKMEPRRPTVITVLTPTVFTVEIGFCDEKETFRL